MFWGLLVQIRRVGEGWAQGSRFEIWVRGFGCGLKARGTRYGVSSLGCRMPGKGWVFSAFGGLIRKRMRLKVFLSRKSLWA